MDSGASIRYTLPVSSPAARDQEWVEGVFRSCVAMRGEGRRWLRTRCGVGGQVKC